MKVSRLELPGVLLIEAKIFDDDRGSFWETWNAERYEAAGIRERFVQDNVSTSVKGVLRGMHYQHPHGQGKLVSVLAGTVFDAVVDIRVGSPDFGRWTGCTLSAEAGQQLYIPAGFAHGFVVLSDTAIFSYKCTDVYVPEAEGSIVWNDPEIGIDWPVEAPILSGKDRDAAALSRVSPERLPTYGGGELTGGNA